ncbi:hypothetical protein KIPB_001515 [Kipferlia bialata]|uniref:Uncharacterized protein n=1 Tax=Kipferlia bialata TaxID=797122 RepID=A0A9K3GG01_9EUKA|nr:hypothetical protein KIPB_001271 [Kipferlia bialata]GIQ80681.1 hypothetical protein KIPB_001515 [Kipferlia bialata]|eukprot:g1271.t1
MPVAADVVAETDYGLYPFESEEHYALWVEEEREREGENSSDPTGGEEGPGQGVASMTEEHMRRRYFRLMVNSNLAYYPDEPVYRSAAEEAEAETQGDVDGEGQTKETFLTRRLSQWLATASKQLNGVGDFLAPYLPELDIATFWLNTVNALMAVLSLIAPAASRPTVRLFLLISCLTCFAFPLLVVAVEVGTASLPSQLPYLPSFQYLVLALVFIPDGYITVIASVGLSSCLQSVLILPALSARIPALREVQLVRVLSSKRALLMYFSGTVIAAVETLGLLECLCRSLLGVQYTVKLLVYVAFICLRMRDNAVLQGFMHTLKDKVEAIPRVGPVSVKIGELVSHTVSHFVTGSYSQPEVVAEAEPLSEQE